MKLKVSFESENPISVVEYKYAGAKRTSASYPIVLTAHAKATYFQQRQAFSITGFLFGNPMALIMIFSVFMVIGMPMMMKNIDPEELKKMQKESILGAHAGGQDPMKELGQMFGMAPKTDEDDD